MRKFFYKLAKATAIIYCCMLGIQWIVDYALRKDNCCHNNTWHKIFAGDLNADIIVMGTSRAQSHYDPKIISKITGLKAYNLGLSGTHYNCLPIIWKSYLNHNHKPKIVILDLDESGLQDGTELFDKMQYLPYSGSDEYQNVAKTIDPDFYYERFIPLLKYRGYEMQVYRQVKSQKNCDLCSGFIDGYELHDQQWIEKDYQFFKTVIAKDRTHPKTDTKVFSQSLKALDGMLADCRKNNIKLYFVWSPSYFEKRSYQVFYRKYIDTKIMQIASEQKIPYYNFSFSPLCDDRNNFYNSAHLNKRGATEFSTQIGQIIARDLNTQSR